jgi:excisionase family DNA binding protein
MKKLMDVPEIAEYLGVSPKWVYEDARKHGLPLYKVGRALRAKPEEVEKWLNQQRV